eukprot:m.34967 g.34967  ORF g.34967 m.34967 type:complete len:455 (-) comp5286_c0_seq1:1278-2642(-)
MAGGFAEVFLRPANPTVEAVSLAHGEPVMLGRLPELRIKSPRCSRTQLEITADWFSEAVKLKQYGTHPCSVNGQLVEKGSSKLLKDNDVLLVLADDQTTKFTVCIKHKAPQNLSGAPETQPMAVDEDDDDNDALGLALGADQDDGAPKQEHPAHEDVAAGNSPGNAAAGRTSPPSVNADMAAPPLGKPAELITVLSDNAAGKAPSPTSAASSNGGTTTVPASSVLEAMPQPKIDLATFLGRAPLAPPARVAPAVALTAFPPMSAGTTTPPPAARGGHWSDALYEFCRAPERYPTEVLYSDNDVVVINDKFPKARVHLLIMPRRKIDNLSNLLPTDLPLLEQMQSVASTFIARHKNLTFRTGFHACPSMRQLHMHVISQDFDSQHLKTKRHWNSFTSPFFVGSKIVYKTLRDKGVVRFERTEYERYLERDLGCHVCKETFRTMPQLKAHIVKHAP